MILCIKARGGLCVLSPQYVKIYRTKGTQGPSASIHLDNGTHLDNAKCKNYFQDSSPRKSPRTMSLDNNAALCISGSMIPKPPSSRGRIIVRQAAQGLLSLNPSQPLHKKLRTNLCNRVMALGKSVEQDAMNQAEARRT